MRSAGSPIREQNCSADAGRSVGSARGLCRTPDSFQLREQLADALARGFVLSKPLSTF